MSQELCESVQKLWVESVNYNGDEKKHRGCDQNVGVKARNKEKKSGFKLILSTRTNAFWTTNNK